MLRVYALTHEHMRVDRYASIWLRHLSLLCGRLLRSTPQFCDIWPRQFKLHTRKELRVSLYVVLLTYVIFFTQHALALGSAESDVSSKFSAPVS